MILLVIVCTVLDNSIPHVSLIDHTCFYALSVEGFCSIRTDLDQLV